MEGLPQSGGIDVIFHCGRYSQFLSEQTAYLHAGIARDVVAQQDAAALRLYLPGGGQTYSVDGAHSTDQGNDPVQHRLGALLGVGGGLLGVRQCASVPQAAFDHRAA